ncbi:unnamed protein product, partial [Aphanomyces euteiches]
METLLKQITTYDVHAPWSEQLQALADIKAVVEQVLQVDSRDAVVDTLTILTEPFKTDCWIESIRADVVHRARGFLSGLATTCGFALGQFVDDMMVSLVDAARSHIEKICQAGDDCVAVLASPSRYNVNKLIHTFDTVRGDDVRLLIMSQLELIVKTWSQADLDPYVEGIKNVLAKGLDDKSESVREKARDTLCLLRGHETFNISQVKSSLSSEFGLGAGRTDSVLMHSPLFPPAFRYANEAVAKLWLDTVVADYAKIAGVSICKGGAGQAVRRDVPMLMQSFAAAAPVENVPDVDITAVYGLKAFLAHKFKTFSEITDNMSVHELATGKSAVQNEVVGELEADAKTWINSVMDEYGSVFSVTIPYASKAGGAASAGVPMMGGGVSSAELDALKAQMSTMMREQVNAYQA